MRRTVLGLFLCSIAVCTSPAADRFDLDGYQSADGSISLAYRGDDVEPYFATKALLVAQAGGLDVREPVRRWIHWLLPRQDKNKHGSFGRYSRKSGQEWRFVAPADADDSMLALWLQLLYTDAPDSGIPVEWRQSVEKARSNLDSLRNSRLGVYHVSRQNHVALLMDNAEIYSALMDIARSQERFGERAQAEATYKQAETLDYSIQHVFWNKHAQWFRPSIQKSWPAFYPDVVAQVYPWLAGMPMTDAVQARDVWLSWKVHFAAEWLEKKFDPHPWGLVAIAALKLGDDESAACWLSHSRPLRFGTNWNVLEEAAFQVVQGDVDAAAGSDPEACLKVSSAK